METNLIKARLAGLISDRDYKDFLYKTNLRILNEDEKHKLLSEIQQLDYLIDTINEILTKIKK